MRTPDAVKEAAKDRASCYSRVGYAHLGPYQGYEVYTLRVFDELKSICSITIYVIKDSDKLLDLSYINTFVDITGASDEIETKCIEIKDILNKHHILYKEISEEKVKDSLLFLLENRY